MKDKSKLLTEKNFKTFIGFSLFMLTALSIGNSTVWNPDFLLILVPLIVIWLTVKDVAQLLVDLNVWSKKRQNMRNKKRKKQDMTGKEFYMFVRGEAP